MEKTEKERKRRKNRVRANERKGRQNLTGRVWGPASERPRAQCAELEEESLGPCIGEAPGAVR